MTSARTTVPTLRSLGVLGALALALTACGGSSASTSAGTTAASSPSGMAGMSMGPSSSPVSGAELDKAFISGMVTHHSVALDMAKAELASGKNAEVKALAQKIIDAQTKEIATLQQVAKGSYSFTPSPSPAMPMGEMMGVPMTTDMSQMAEMVKTAADPDMMFLTMMIPHHASAISMADEERNKGANATLKSLAQTVVSDQAKEIGEMQAMLAAM